MPSALQEMMSRLVQLVRGVGGKHPLKSDSSDRPATVRAGLRDYLDSQRQFMKIADTCSQKGWPDRGAVLYYTWECQKLYIQRQEIRFEHLFSRGEFESGVWKSLSSITDRLDKNWSDIDERGVVLGGNSAYEKLMAEITELEHSRASLDKDLLDGPLRALQRYAEYRTARQAIHDKVHEFDRRLAELDWHMTNLKFK
jgi:hypothetical protein